MQCNPYTFDMKPDTLTQLVEKCVADFGIADTLSTLARVADTRVKLYTDREEPARVERWRGIANRIRILATTLPTEKAT